MLVCALLVAALAVQPAAGDSARADTSARAAAVVQDLGAAQSSPLAAPPTTSTTAAPPSTGGPKPDTPAPPGGTAPVDAVPNPVPSEQGDPGTPPAAPQQTAPAEAPAAAREPAPEQAFGAREPVAPPETARSQSSAGTSQGTTPTAESPRTNALAVAPAGTADVGTLETGTGPVAVPDPGAGSTQSPAGFGTPTAGAASTPRPAAVQRSPGAGAGDARRAQPRLAAAIPTSALAAVLSTPATEAITRLRSGADETSQPQQAPGDAPPLADPTGPSGRGTSVREVLFWPAAVALAVLGLLVIALGTNAYLARSRTRRLERQRERLMEDIGLLQAALLPAVPSRLGALLTTVAYRPADGPAAGGDFYDAFALPDGRVGLLLGDVSGHGRQALAKTTLVRFTVRAHLEAGLSPREAITISGRSLDGRLSDDFATVIAAIHDPVKGTLTYASAGHPPPIVVGPSRHRPVTASSAPPIGAGFPTGQRQTVLPMPEGASVMIYSDGLLEARLEGVPIGAERLAAWLKELGPEATARAILDRVVDHADRVPDDLAAVLVHAAPGATAPAARIEQLKLDVLDMDGPDLDGFMRAAGVSEVDRLLAGRRVSELLATASGVIVEVRTGEHPMVSVAPLGDDSGISVRPSARTR